MLLEVTVAAQVEQTVRHPGSYFATAMKNYFQRSKFCEVAHDGGRKQNRVMGSKAPTVQERVYVSLWPRLQIQVYITITLPHGKHGRCGES